MIASVRVCKRQSVQKGTFPMLFGTTSAVTIQDDDFGLTGK